jgi:hypothetical protein
MDKSKNRLQYLAENIVPKFSISELEFFLDDMKNTAKKKKQTKSNYELKDIGEDYDTTADISKLTEAELKQLYQVFISRELNDTFAVKWRFYQYFKYIRDIFIESIKINISKDGVDFLIKRDNGENIIVICTDVLDAKTYNVKIEEIQKFVKKEKIIPNFIMFAANKSYRDISIEEPLIIDKKEIKIELWLELADENRPFSGEDLLIMENTDLKLAGFNFTSLQDLLDYIYEFSEGGQISIIRQIDFFSETLKQELETELIWKGIMIKNDIS